MVGTEQVNKRVEWGEVGEVMEEEIVTGRGADRYIVGNVVLILSMVGIQWKVFNKE